MKSKILLGFGVLAVTLAVLPMFAAFEAHVINVTAQIENALSVNTDPISFGTVFPQEQLDRFFNIDLSASFLAEERVDDVEYIIRQKPKCAVLENGNIVGETVSGHVDDNGNIYCPEVLDPTGQPIPYQPLPLLCPYLSKHEETVDQNRPSGSDRDGSLAAFHPIGATTTQGWVWTDVNGYLSHNDLDINDRWKLDLKVPCFEGYCAQDWADYVHGINAEADPDDYVQPAGNEHALFGCDIWIEVTGVSTSTPSL